MNWNRSADSYRVGECRPHHIGFSILNLDWTLRTRKRYVPGQPMSPSTRSSHSPNEFECSPPLKLPVNRLLRYFLRQSTLLNDEVCDRFNPFAALQIRENEGPLPAHSERVRLHYAKVRAYQRSQVDHVDNEKIGARNSRTALTRDLLTFRNVDHVDRQVRQFWTESSRQVISARFDKADFRSRGFLVHLFNGGEVHRSVLSNCGVRAASGFDSHNALRGEGLRTGKDELILLRIDVIRNHVNVVCVAEALAQRFNKRRFACPYRPADAYAQRMVLG